MRFDPNKHHRRSIGLKEYDYTEPGGYFITIVTHQRDCIFGNVVNGKMQLDALGIVANVKAGSLGAIVRSYKSAVPHRIGREFNATGIWQRNYYEHVIRDHKESNESIGTRIQPVQAGGG